MLIDSNLLVHHDYSYMVFIFGCEQEMFTCNVKVCVITAQPDLPSLIASKVKLASLWHYQHSVFLTLCGTMTGQETQHKYLSYASYKILFLFPLKR